MHIPTSAPAAAGVLPRTLSGFAELVYNLHWTWSPAARRCFALASPEVWAATGNPLELLLRLPAARWRALARDAKFLRAYRDATAALAAHVAERASVRPSRNEGRVAERASVQPSRSEEQVAERASVQPSRNEGRVAERASVQPLHEDRALAGAVTLNARGPVAYFCMEYGWHECLPIFCGGLGVLAGDHTKTASDIALPFVGVGMLYRRGFFIQQIEPDGRQANIFPSYDFNHWPVRPVATKDGRDLVVGVEFPGRVVRAKVWFAQVGRVPVLLLDTDIAPNDPADRAITSQLYCRGREMRVCQERLIGIGGVRALRALGIAPAAWHLNEGHCVFLQIERLRELKRRGVAFEEACRRIAANTVFTTHTPIPVGNEQFDPALVKKYFAADCRQLGITFQQLHRLALERNADTPVRAVAPSKNSADRSVRATAEPFNLTALAIRLSSYQNGVSKLNAKVENAMWRHLWPRRPNRIDAVTNGVHAETWLGPEIVALFDRYAGRDWRARLCDRIFWREAVGRIPNAALWRARERQKARLIAFVRERVTAQRARYSASPDDVRAAAGLLDPRALTIGFARRVAPYKRADLLFADPKRLRRILDRRDRPVQFIFAGKAHYEDRAGQELLQRLFAWCERPEFRGRIVLLEDYDMAMARLLVQGVDVWLNNPQRPLEASGTSGQKAAINGAPNCSVLDGWWPEAWDGTNGWAIGAGREFADPRRQARHDAASLYDLLERDIAPRFHHRDRARWIAVMKTGIATVLPRFNSERMLRDYIARAYGPAAARAATVPLADVSRHP
ncbi:MAG: alpha-glucan family phosphorylase [Verrucomicrobia bacterium]|nr:alpha-glucan family phosphorylase [Verrucomicrobiota bacterium]